MKCEMCGKDIDHLSVDCFTYEGADRPVDYYINECENNAVYIDTTANWTGYELSDEERAETIECPHCGKFPFKEKEIQVYDIVRVVMFRNHNPHPEIIFCGECKYYQDNNGGYPHENCKWNKDETPDPDDYCSGGERIET